MAWFGFVRNSIAEDQQTISRFLQERKAPSLKKGHLRASQEEEEGDRVLLQERIPQCYSIS